MAMSKKDYERIADSMKRHMTALQRTNPVAVPVAQAVVVELADSLRGTNPAYSKDRFIAACTPDDPNAEE